MMKIVLYNTVFLVEQVKKEIVMRISKILKSKSGLTLIEILIAMTVLALVIGPLFKCFMMSSKINAKSRKLMCANDAAQSIMEGFADKSYQDILNTVNALRRKSGTPGGQLRFSTINDDYYNLKELNDDYVKSINVPDAGSSLEGKVTTIQKDKISVAGFAQITTKDINNPENLAKLDVVHRNMEASTILQAFLKSSSVGGEPKGIYLYEDNPNNYAMVLVYSDVVSGGYHFDVVCGFYPMADNNNSSTKWFPYLIYMTVYERGETVSAVDATYVLNGTNQPLLKLKSGTRNKKTPN